MVYLLLALLPVAALLPSQAPGEVSSAAEKAMQSIQSGDAQGAKQVLEDVLRHHPGEVSLWNLLGIADGELQETAAAEQAFRRGLQLMPDSITLNENLGLLYYKRADYVNAEKYLGKAVSLGSENPAVRFSFAGAELRNGKRALALAQLRQLEPSLGTRSEYWEERGMAELPTDAAQAEESFDHALHLNPNSLRALNGAAWAAERKGLDEKALSLLIKARNVNPDDVATLMHFANVCLRRDLGMDAEQAAKQAYKLQPANNSALYLLARSEISLSNWQQAYDLFDQFSKRVPNFPLTYFAMGWLDIKLDRTQEARQMLEHCLSLAPQVTDARYELAQLELDDGHLNRAEDLLREVLKQQPRHAKANMAMGDLMMRRGQLDQAQQYLEKATKQDPELGAAHYKLSMLYFRKHQPEAGEKEKAMARELIAKVDKASKVQLKLIMPETGVTQ